MLFSQSLSSMTGIVLLTLSSTVFADFSTNFSSNRTEDFFARCTQIRFYEKGKTLFGQKYKRYAVRCSDGSQAEITGWQDGQWCIGRASSQCSNNQMETANAACR